MGIKIVIEDKVRFKVKGVIRDEAGIDQPFDFSLTCLRMDADQIKAKLSSDSDASIFDFLVDVVEDWAGVRGGDNALVPYSEDALRELCRIPGVAAVAFRTYLSEVGAREKN
jgi:hypothetical protein